MCFRAHISIGRDVDIEGIEVAQLKEKKKWKAKLSYATLSTTIKLNWIELDLIKGNQIILNK